MCVSLDNRSTKFTATMIKNDELREYANVLVEDSMNIRANLLHMSAVMATIASKRDTGILEEFDGSIANFAEQRLGIKHAQTYAMIEVGATFLDDKGVVKLQQVGGRWSNTQLMALLPMGGKAKDRTAKTTLEACKKLISEKKIRPSMTVAEIKEVVRVERPDAKPTDEDEKKSSSKGETTKKVSKKNPVKTGEKIMTVELLKLEDGIHVTFNGKEMKFDDANIDEIVKQLKQAKNYVTSK